MLRFIVWRAGAAGLGFLLAWIPPLEGAGRPGGFSGAATPAERQLAERPQPDGYFREMTGFWHGAPGLGALRSRWEGFAKEDQGFAVLAALLAEAEGRPEEALEKLRGLTGSQARWNEGRLLALLGRGQEAEAVFSSLVTAAEQPEMGAAALIALTERDSIRGDFAAALQRSTAAWEARPEGEFRLRILERHLSLLVEAGQEKAFVEEQVKAAESTGDEAAAGTAQRVLAVMGDWFTEDVRLREAREKLKSSFFTGVTMMVTGGRPGGTLLRETMECGILRPRGPALEVLGQDAAASLETAGSLAYQISVARRWPETLDGQPLLKQAFAAQPLHLSRMLFYNPDPVQPLPPLARTLADGMEAGVERRTVDLVERAWAGRAGPGDAEALASIIIEAHQLRRLRPPGRPSQGSQWMTGWPALPDFPTEQVIWNLSGEPWADFYRSSCRLAPLVSHGSMSGFYGEEGRVAAWRQWRPEWPAAQETSLIVWAWKQLMMMGEATGERAAEIARRMTDPGDRFLFAAQCRRKELLEEWCRDEDLLRQVNSMALMQAVLVLQNNDQEPPAETGGQAALAIAREMARRLDLPAPDLIRSLGTFSQHAPAELKRGLQARPVNLILVDTLGMHSGGEDGAIGEAWKARLLRTVPHPLYGLPLNPSVERFRVLAALLQIPRDNHRMGGFRTPLQQMVQGFFGGEGLFHRGSRASELLRALETFPTAHPLKGQLPRWDALRQSFKLDAEGEANRMQGFGERGKEQDVNLTKALRVMAEEEQAFLPWHLVRASLEENPAKRALLLELVQARGPLAAGAGRDLPVPPAHQPGMAATGATTAASGSAPGRPTPEVLADMFAKLLADPATRRQFEPAGALSEWMRKGGSSDAFMLSLNRTPPTTNPETAQLLMDLRDPLAARMAVILIAGQHRPEVTAPWLVRALAMFPDDPELLLAHAALDSQEDEATEAGLAAFRRAMTLLGAITPFGRETQPVWCGIEERQVSQTAETVRALAAFAERSRPATIPQSWVQTIENVLADPDELPRMSEPEVRSAVLAAVRYKSPWRSGNGTPRGWLPLLERLALSGMKEEAGVAAEALLAKPAGSLGYPGGPAEPAPPWNNSSDGDVTGPKAEGWKLLQLAAREDPAGLADRLLAVAAVHPADEHTALVALLARGNVRPLTGDDLKITTRLSSAGRHRVLAYASWLLPADRLPDALVLESWEAEAKVEFSDVWNGTRNFQQGIAYLNRLEKAGAAEAVRRVLPDLLKSVKTVGGFPKGYPGLLFRRLERLGTPAQVEQLHTILADLLKKLPDGPASYEKLAAALHLQAEESGLAEPPAELVRRVTRALESASSGEGATTQATGFSLYQLAHAAAGHPRWHDLLRRLLARQTKAKEPTGRSLPWHTLSVLMGVLDSGRVIPDVALHLSPQERGQGTLTWKFQGLMPPPLPEQDRLRGEEKTLLPWPTLAAAQAGKFDALVFVTGDERPAGERLAARIEKLPATGKMSLEGLPPTGRLHLLLIQRDAPQSTAETTPVGYNTLPVLMDTAHPPAPSSPHPQGWQLLCEPCALTASQWQINRSDVPSAPWPDGLALLLLDESHQVCAIAEPSREPGLRPPDAVAFSSATIAQHQFSPEPVPPETKSGLRITGTPRWLALAKNRRISGRQNDDFSGSNPRPRFTVQELPSPGDASATTGFMEIIRSWHLPATGGSRHHRQVDPVFRQSPLQAAWYDGDGLTLLDLEKDVRPRTMKLDVPPSAILQEIYWSGGKMHLHFYVRPGVNTSPGVSMLFSPDLDSSAPAPPPHEFKKLVQFQSLEPHGIPGALTIFSENAFFGIVNAEGRVLTLESPPAASKPPLQLMPVQALTATSIACHPGPDQRYPVLDWTEGPLRLRFTEKIPSRLPRSPREASLQISHEGMLAETSGNSHENWKSPLRLRSIQSIGGGRALGIATASDETGRSIVLLRKVRAQP